MARGTKEPRRLGVAGGAGGYWPTRGLLLGGTKHQGGDSVQVVGLGCDCCLGKKQHGRIQLVGT